MGPFLCAPAGQYNYEVRALQWPVKETYHPYPAQRPLLSILVPTFNRPEEMTFCLQSIIEQIDAELAPLVEVVVSDNDSSAQTQSIIRQFAAQNPFMGYYLNAKNGGGVLQVLTAPSRVRGEWIWIYGDDDLLLPGGVRRVLERLQKDRPAFLTLNRCVIDNTLSQIIMPSKHDVPSANYPTLIDLFGAIGVDQISFFSSQVYHTDTALMIDEEKFSTNAGNFGQVAYYLDGFSDLPAAYEAEAFVVHRWNPNAQGTHTSNFLHLATSLPRMIAQVRDRKGLASDLLEQLGGGKFVGRETRSDLTYVDNLLHYLFHTISSGMSVPFEDWRFLESEAQNWRPEHSSRIKEAKALADSLAGAAAELAKTQAALDALASDKHTPDTLKRLFSVQLRDRLGALTTQMGNLTAQASEKTRFFT